MIEREQLTARSKHIEARCFWLKGQNHLVRVCKVPTAMNPSGLATKALPRPTFEKFQKILTHDDESYVDWPQRVDEMLDVLVNDIPPLALITNNRQQLKRVADEQEPDGKQVSRQKTFKDARTSM